MEFPSKKFNLKKSLINEQFKALIINPNSINPKSLTTLIKQINTPQKNIEEMLDNNIQINIKDLRNNKDLTLYNLKLQDLYSVQYKYKWDIDELKDEELFKQSYHPTH